MFRFTATLCIALVACAPAEPHPSQAPMATIDLAPDDACPGLPLIEWSIA